MSDYDFAVKSRAAAHIDELVRAGKFAKYKEDYEGLHENDIGEDGFNYFNAYFRDIDGKYYVVKFSSGINNNEETVYSIGNIRKRRYSVSRGSSSSGGAQIKDAIPSGDIIVYSFGESQVQNAMQEAFARALDEKNGKAEFSREMDPVAALEKQVKLLRKQKY